ncbi:Gypsy retrotransposon integrase-like protein 1 [Recurvomyces mirabilis]|uniref:Gypsy retrotransposon integrase-like protein 1 n=1 Tax=Recurvomyces mirabilis TaxID=574656 RepID=A0AAE0TSI4_9PEZI|nr:Gypsy retrotransposon integrase-like protein 1 [Recurvomyces mirabilis]KAK5159743.1 Gypsy retrotransposon integrase-like protein 1 [Recurvomyces mirabilis]
MSKLACVYEDGGRMTSTEYIQSLEKKVSELEALLGHPATLSLSRSDSQALESQSSPSTTVKESPPDDIIETIVDTRKNGARSAPVDERTPVTHRHDLNPHHFGGLSLLGRVHRLCQHVSGMRHENGDEEDDNDLASGFEIAPPESNMSISWEAFALLPSRENVDEAIDVVLGEATCNMQFLDRSTLNQMADTVFHEIEAESTPHTRKPLALIYAVIALGRLFRPVLLQGRKGPITLNGLRYFRASRALLDPASCQDVISLQTLLCMITYTNGASMMSTCYSYICMAVAAALQMGIYSDLVNRDMPEEERRTRQVIFTVLSMTDTYVTTALGLPRTLRDIDPERALLAPPNAIDYKDPMYGTYMHAQLIQILATTVETNHPFTRPIETKNGTYGVEYSKIVATEEKLEQWLERLQQTPLSETHVGDSVTMRSQLMLRLYYAHVQMVLYRPFLHHALRNAGNGSRTSLKAYACGSACIKAGMQAVWLVEKLEASSLFNSSLWFIKFIITFTSACLTLFVTSNAGGPTVNETADAVRRIKELCRRHAHENDSLRRCLNFLESVPMHGKRIESVDSELWDSFVASTQSFGEAFRAAADVDEGNNQSEDHLQALSLPQFQSFVNTRL